MEPETYLERVYACLENAKRTRDQTERQQWIEDAVTWHTAARIAEEICAEGGTLPQERSSAARLSEQSAPGRHGAPRG